MPINNEKYFYINRVGLTRGSWAQQKFEDDAVRHHMEDQPGKLVAIRLTDYYELIERIGGPAAATMILATREEQGSARLPSTRLLPQEEEANQAGSPIEEGFDDDVDDQWSL